MSTRNDYSADEWKAISAAPLAAGLALSFPATAGPSTVGSGAADVGRAICRSTFRDAPEIAKVIADLARTEGDRADLPEVSAGNRLQSREMLIAIVGVAVHAVETKSPGEVEPFKVWLASVAAKVLHASRTVGAPSSNGAPVDRDEQETIDRLADVLAAHASGSVTASAQSIPAADRCASRSRVPARSRVGALTQPRRTGRQKDH